MKNQEKVQNQIDETVENMKNIINGNDNAETVVEEEKNAEENAPKMEEKTIVEKEIVTEKKKSIPFLTILLAIVAIVLGVLLYTNSFASKTYKLNSIYDCFQSDNAVLKLPASYLLSDSGEIFKNEKGYLVTKGAFATEVMYEEDYKSTKESFIEYYGASEEEINGMPALRIEQAADDGTLFTYLFLYKDGIFSNFVYLDCSNEEINLIVNGINY